MTGHVLNRTVGRTLIKLKIEDISLKVDELHIKLFKSSSCEPTLWFQIFETAGRCPNGSEVPGPSQGRA